MPKPEPNSANSDLKILVIDETPIRSGFYAQFKYANYQADQFFTDVQKVIFGLGYQY